MDYVRLAQPRIVALFLLAVVAAMLLAGRPGVTLVAQVVAATALTVGGAAMLNNVLEAKLDRSMRRTRRRPTATGAVDARRAVLAGAAMIVVGAAALWLWAGAGAAGLALGGAAYYVAVYTLLLKPHLALSAVPGSLAGVFPPLIGWAAVGAPATASIAFLCAFIVCWSPPHSWALVLTLADEYESAGIPTPVGRYGPRATRRLIVAAVAVLTALTMAPAIAGIYGPVYLWMCLGAGAALWWLAIRLAVKRTPAASWAFFKGSGPYLAVVLVAMLLGDRL